MNNLQEGLIRRIIEQLDADGHYELVNEILRVKHFTPKYVPFGACGCGGWGCLACCSSESEIRGRQGTFG